LGERQKISASRLFASIAHAKQRSPETTAREDHYRAVIFKLLPDLTEEQFQSVRELVQLWFNEAPHSL
jgi:hypothetical protein